MTFASLHSPYLYQLQLANAGELDYFCLFSGENCTADVRFLAKGNDTSNLPKPLIEISSTIHNLLI